MAVGVFLRAHMTIVRQVAFVKVLAHIFIFLDVFGSQIPVPLRVDGLEIRMHRGCALHIVFAGIRAVGSRACKEQCAAGQRGEVG